MMHDPEHPQGHFAFGKNWAEYADKVTETEIAEAKAGLMRLIGPETVQGKRFLDIGSGSGLHSLAAMRLGAQSVTAIDIDGESAATTRALLMRFAPQTSWRVEKNKRVRPLARRVGYVRHRLFVGRVAPYGRSVAGCAEWRAYGGT